MRPLVILLAALVLADSASAAPPEAQFDRTCETHAEGPNPEDIALPKAGRDVIAGRVSILRAQLVARRLGAKPPYNPRAWIFKTPVIIRAGAPVVIRVAERDRPYVALDFDTRSNGGRDRVAEDAHSSVRFHACPPDTKRFSDGKPIGEWTGYPGGLIVERRRCVTLEFLEEGQPVVKRRVGFGRRCR